MPRFSKHKMKLNIKLENGKQQVGIDDCAMTHAEKAKEHTSYRTHGYHSAIRCHVARYRAAYNNTCKPYTSFHNSRVLI